MTEKMEVTFDKENYNSISGAFYSIMNTLVYPLIENY